MHNFVGNHTWVFFIKQAGEPTVFNGIENLLSVLLGTVIGALITFLTTLWLKNDEIKSISLTNAKCVSTLLIKERASLKQIQFLIEETKRKQLAQQMPIRELFLGIKQDNLEKILAYKKFYNKRFFLECEDILQKLISAEQIYRHCYELVNAYNQSVKDYLLIKDSGAANEVKKAFMFDLNSNLEVIDEKYNEAIQLNEGARKGFDKLCAKIFGNKYKPVPTGEIVKSTEM